MMHTTRSMTVAWSLTLCSCSRDTVHFHYGNVVLHIAIADLKELAKAMKTISAELASDSVKQAREKLLQ